MSNAHVSNKEYSIFEIAINLIITSIFGYLFLHYIALPELPRNEEDLEYLIQYILNGIGKNSTLKNTHL